VRAPVVKLTAIGSVAESRCLALCLAHDRLLPKAERSKCEGMSVSVPRAQCQSELHPKRSNFCVPRIQMALDKAAPEVNNLAPKGVIHAKHFRLVHCPHHSETTLLAEDQPNHQVNWQRSKLRKNRPIQVGTMHGSRIAASRMLCPGMASNTATTLMNIPMVTVTEGHSRAA
jgi:hypothetical protein